MFTVLSHTHSIAITCFTFALISISQATITQHDRHFFKFVTRPDIDAPVFRVNVYDRDALAPGHWFVAPYGQLSQKKPGQEWVGPHIYDDLGDLVWSGASMVEHWNAFDFESRVVGAERMITFLSDHEKHGFILESSYQLYKKVPLLRGQEVKSNMHEFNVIDDGKRALTLTHTRQHPPQDAAKALGVHESCLTHYQGFRDVDLASPHTNNVVFEWDASEHIGLDEVTYRKYDGTVEEQCTRGWDILHLNSVDIFPDGDYLLSARHTDAIYKISRQDGSILWRLGGLKSDFVLRDWKFSRQHHARVLGQNDTHIVLTMFDNGVGDGPFAKPSSPHARALTVLLDTTAMMATIMEKYIQPGGVRTNARGSFQTLPNGNKFICWAYNSLISKHASNSSLLMEAKFQLNLVSYRAFKHPRIGRPNRPPDIHSESLEINGGLITVVHISWNGDTRTAVWRFYEITNDKIVRLLGATQRQGFESRYEHGTFVGRVFAESLDASGKSLGKSKVVRTRQTRSFVANDTHAADDQQSGWGCSDATEGKEVEPHARSALFAQFAVAFVCGSVSLALIGGILWWLYRCSIIGSLGRYDVKYVPLKASTTE